MKEIKKYLLKIRIIKAYYIGKEMLKNPPTVELLNGTLDSVKITNAITKCGTKKVCIKNCEFIKTFDL